MFIDIAIASETAMESSAAPASEGVIASLGVNSTLLIFQFINFALVFLVLWFLILKPLSKKLAERQKMIDESVENSRKIEEILKQSERRYQDRIDVAKSEANAILERTKIEADMIAEEAKNKTKNDMEVMVNQAKTRIAAEKDDMVADMKKETAGLIVAAMQKILGEKIDEKTNQKLINDALKQLSK